ncbi:VanZ family protein [Chloroflexota bacterium]
MRKFVAYFPYWVPVVLWMGVIFFLSTLPDSDTPGRFLVSDKVLHAAEYFILAFLIFFSLQRTTWLRFYPSFWVTLAWIILYGLSDELHQSYVPTRNCDFTDLVADMCGMLLLFLILWALQKSGKRGETIYRLLAGKERP